MCHDVRIPIPIPWCPYPTPCLPTYIHVYIIVYVCDDVCVYLIVFVFALFFLLLSLSLLLFSLFFFSYSLLACGKACPWAGAAGLIFLVYVNVLFYLIIIQQHTCIVCVYVSLCIVQCMCIHHVLCMYPTDVCMYIVQYVLCCVYVHSIVCTVLCVCGPVHTQQYTCCAVQYRLPVHSVPLCIACVYNIHAVYSVLFILQYTDK